MQKNEEAGRSEAEQLAIRTARDKFAPRTFRAVEARTLSEQLKDTVVFNAHSDLERGNPIGCFLRLYGAAAAGNLDNYKTFSDLCEVLEDRVHRETSSNVNLKYGIRYPQSYLNFMILMRSHGGNSSRQYGLITSQLGGPSPRHLR
jgi:hypothetical protein